MPRPSFQASNWKSTDTVSAVTLPLNGERAENLAFRGNSMLRVILPVLWIAFDVAICIRTAFMTQPMEWEEILAWGTVGLILGLTALAAGWWEREEKHKEEVKYERDRGELRSQIERSSGFNEGAFKTLESTIQRIESATPESSGAVVSKLQEELQKYRSRMAEISWTPLTADQKTRLRNGLSKLRPAKLDIGYYESSSGCEQLARELEQIFRDVGWTLDEKAYEVKSRLNLSEPLAFRGISLAGNDDLTNTHDVRDVLNDVLPGQAESSKNLRKSDMPIISLCVGLKRPGIQQRHENFC